jgi:type I restriction enzyme S subunit
MKKGWETKRLGDVCEIIKGRKPALKAPASSRDLPYLVAKFMRGSAPAEYASVEDRNSIVVEESETIIICDGSNSGEVFTGFRGILSSTMGKIAKKAEINDDYLRAFLASTFEVFNGAKTGAAIPHLDKEAMYQLQLPIPPLAEQQRIVGVLDEAFEGLATAKANAEKNLQNARALFESRLQSVFTQRGVGWIQKSLQELGTITSSKRIFKNEYVKSGVPFYRTKEIKELANGHEITTELFISEARYKEIKTSFGVPKKGDVLLTAIGTIGEIWVVEGNRDFYFKDGNVLWLKGFASIHPRFLKYVLMSFVDSLNKIAHGSAYSALPIQRLNSHRIFLPPPAEQEHIVAQLNDLSAETQRLAAIYEQKLAALEALKKSLLHQAFAGEL